MKALMKLLMICLVGFLITSCASTNVDRNVDSDSQTKEVIERDWAKSERYHRLIDGDHNGLR